LTDDTRSFCALVELIEPDALVPEPDVPEAVVPEPVVPALVVPEPLVPDVFDPLEVSIVPVTSTLWPTCDFRSVSCPSSMYVEPDPVLVLLVPLAVPDVVPDVPVLLDPDDPELIIAFVSM